jgi:hypothetical protein
MKKLIFFSAFFLILGVVGTQAQSCHGNAAATKSCCASKAAKAASSDASIEMRKADDGTVSYVRKNADAQGNVQFVSVQYDEASNTFVNAAPGSIHLDDKAGTTKKACTATEKKACAGEKGGKACCASKAGAKVEQ